MNCTMCSDYPNQNFAQLSLAESDYLHVESQGNLTETVTSHSYLAVPSTGTHTSTARALSEPCCLPSGLTVAI